MIFFGGGVFKFRLMVVDRPKMSLFVWRERIHDKATDTQPRIQNRFRRSSLSKHISHAPE